MAGAFRMVVVVVVVLCAVARVQGGYATARMRMAPDPSFVVTAPPVNTYGPLNFPPIRSQGSVWRHFNDPNIVWSYGGFYGQYLCGSTDLWQFNLTSNQWKLARQGTNYNHGSGNFDAVTWPYASAENNVIPSQSWPNIAWLYGGYYCLTSPPFCSSGACPTVNSLFVFNATSLQWKSIGGQSTTTPGYGTNCVTGSLTVGGNGGNYVTFTGTFPYIRSYAWWTTPSAIYIFGGALGDPAQNQVYSWLDQPSATRASGISMRLEYATCKVCVRVTTIGAEGTITGRRNSFAVSDSARPDAAWIFGGGGYSTVACDAGAYTPNSELWMYNMTAKKFYFYGGFPYGGLTGTPSYGTLNMASGASQQYMASNMIQFVAPPANPGIFYLYGGGLPTGDVPATVWALAVPPSWQPGTPVTWVWVGGAPGAQDYSSGMLGPVDGPFSYNNTLPGMNPYGLVLVDPYRLLVVPGDIHPAASLYAMPEINLLALDWITLPVGDVNSPAIVPPVVRVGMVPTELSAPLNDIMVTLTGDGFAVSNNIAPVVNGYATFDNFTVFGAVNSVRLQAHMSVNDVNDMYSPYFNSRCSMGCLSCVGPGLSFPSPCVTCNEAFGFLISVNGSACVPQCPEQSFAKRQPGIAYQCIACTEGCANCSDTGLADTCSVCDESIGYLRYNGRCVASCPVGYYAETSSGPHYCAPCTTGCLSCVAAGLSYDTACLACDRDRQYLLDSLQTVCTLACTRPNQWKNFAATPGRCVACDVGCVNCTGAGYGAQQCPICDQSLDYVLNDGFCVAECPAGRYKNRAGAVHVCSDCLMACVTCTDGTDVCACRYDANYARTSDGHCVRPCPHGYNISTTGDCVVVSCEVPSQDEYVNDCPLQEYNTTCRMQCPLGTEGSPSTAFCDQVDDNGAGEYVRTPVCVPCKPGFFANVPGGPCLTCPNGVTDGSASTSMKNCLCLPGFYEATPGEGDCVACPAGGACTGGKEQPVAAPGFFENTGAFVTCQPSSACIGNNQCDKGYEGLFCANCAFNYYHLSGFCHECGDTTDVKIAFGVILATIACVLLIYASRPPAVGQYRFAIATPAIALACVQITATFGDIQMNWPSNVVSMFSAFSSLNFNIEIVNAECITQFDFFDKLQVSLIVPMIVFLIFLVVLGIVTAYYWYRFADKATAKHKIRAFAKLVAAGYILFLNLAYLFLSGATLAFFSCKQQADGTWVVAKSPNTFCYDDRWKKFLPLAVFGVIAYILLIPLFLMGVFAYLVRGYGLHIANSDGLVSNFVIKYKERYWYWEFVVIVRKLLIVVVSTFVTADPVVAAVLCAAVMFGSAMLMVKLSPFHWGKHNAIEIVSLTISLLVLLAGILSVASSVTATGREAIGAIVITLIVLTALAMLATFILEVFIKYRIRFKLKRTSDHRGLMVGHGTAVTTLCMEGNVLLSGDTAGLARRWNVDTMDCAASNTMGQGIIVIKFIDSKTIAVGLNDGSLYICAVDTLVAQHRINSPVGSAVSMRALCMTQGAIVTAHDDGALVFWRPSSASGYVVATRHHVQAGVKTVATRDAYIYLALDDGVVVKLRTNISLEVTPVAQWRLNRGRVSGMGIYGSTLYVAAGSTLAGIDDETGELRVECANDPAGVSCLAISEGYVYVGAWSGSVNIWRANGDFRQCAADKLKAVACVTAAPGRYFFSADHGGTIVAWEMREYDDVDDLDPSSVWWRGWRAKHKGKKHAFWYAEFQTDDSSAKAHLVPPPPAGAPLGAGASPSSSGMVMNDAYALSRSPSAEGIMLADLSSQDPDTLIAAFGSTRPVGMMGKDDDDE